MSLKNYKPKTEKELHSIIEKHLAELSLELIEHEFSYESNIPDFLCVDNNGSMEFFTSILISQYIGQYLVNMNKVSLDKTGEKKMEESAIIKSVVYFQIVFLLPGIVIISIGSIVLAILWIILLIIIIKLVVFVSISVAWLLAL